MLSLGSVNRLKMVLKKVNLSLNKILALELLVDRTKFNVIAFTCNFKRLLCFVTYDTLFLLRLNKFRNALPSLVNIPVYLQTKL